MVLLLVSLLSACASLRGKRQVLRLACNTPRCEVFDENQAHLGTAPALISVPRHHKTHLTLTDGLHKTQLPLHGRFRWLDSFAANAMLSYLGGLPIFLVGLTTDFATGAAWNYDTPNTIPLGSKGIPKIIPSTIAIAPPHASSELFSDVMGRQVQQALKEKYPKTEILDYDSTLPHFQRNNYTHEHALFQSEVSRIKTLQKVPVSHIAESQISTDDQRVLANVSVNDAFRTENKETIALSWPKEKLGNAHSLSKNFWTPKLVELLPNSLGLASSALFGSGYGYELQSSTTPSYFYTLEYIPNSDLVAGQLGITAANIRPDYEDRFQYIFRWATDFHFIRAKYKVIRSRHILNQASLIDELGQVALYNLGFGVGPELGISGQFGYLYFNLIPTFGTFYADYFGQSQNEFLGNVETIINLGYLLEIRNQWYFRINSGFSGSDQRRISHVMEKYSQTPVANAFLTQVRVGFSVEYYFPEIRNRIKKKSLDWF